MSRRWLTIVTAALLLCQGGVSAKTKVACIGNSITYGYGLAAEEREQLCYPGRLQSILGDRYEVGNFGHSGATLLVSGHNPYVRLPECRGALEMKPDIAVIHLGVNDTDPRNWPNYSDFFIRDYGALIDSLRAVNPQVRIMIARLTPIGAKHYRFRTGTRDWRLLEQEAIECVSRLKGVELIDFDIPLRDRQNLMPDGIHPDATGYGILAESVGKAITGNYGGLRLPPLYQNGMILQRHRPLTISGSANAGTDVTVTLDGIPYCTTADNLGRWHVVTAPLADGSYTLTVADRDSTITLTNILAGELWIASGQSNMEFSLASAVGSERDIAQCSDPELRFYDMRPLARTNAGQWPDSVLTAIDSLGHFTLGRWESVGPDNAGRLSAIAYYFGRRLRDSLNVPVGIISNGVGGSPCESWIDVNTLEESMPEILVNWKGNDYVQKWCQQRAEDNAPGSHRHPYEPSYLFSAGIRPLGRPDIAGVIWYQGESNAHNTELHEQLFPLLVESWRREFRSPGLPFCFVQLSSLDRPSWPTFRDSQRRLAERMDGVYMSVSSDHGDSLDVHPRNKRPIGERLARQAMRNIYGFSHVTPCGPQPADARAERDGSVTIRFDYADGLTTSDGKSAATFEIADDGGLFVEAQAEILDNGRIRLHTGQPGYRPVAVRYGWQPFTRANLINSDSLPASTFKIAISNMNELYKPEDGFDKGVSACFAGVLPDGTALIAGGCNFPCDEPLSAHAQKKFYKGIYLYDGAEWQRAGSLPEATAYGASATVAEGIVMTGGTTADGATAKTFLIRHDLTTEELPDLPGTLDNIAGAAIGNMVYVAGGNLNGVPCRELYALDLDQLQKGWKRLSRMPGNPRVQPAMAASGGKLYLWGGFAGRHDKHEPTLELDGLVYDPSKDKWSHLEGPCDADGTPVATGGGCAATLPDGRVAIAGGVNKDVFLSALINQAHDYLNHPIGWYRFNPTVFVFNPADGSFAIGESDPRLARAGASAIATADGRIILVGGELKPRIRTNITSKVKP